MYENFDRYIIEIIYYLPEVESMVSSWYSTLQLNVNFRVNALLRKNITSNALAVFFCIMGKEKMANKVCS